MYLHFTPLPVQWVFHRYTWRRRTGSQKIIFLTFDDGPVPEATPFVLDVLEQYQAKATFFCVGDNVGKHSAILQKVVEAGHQVGNHTQNHLNGFRTGQEEYLENVQKCTLELEKQLGIRSRLFRPPYGRIRNGQAASLMPEYEIVMWDVLSADYDQGLGREECLRKSIRYTRNGSIVVFHDSPKAFKNMSWVLPRYLEHFTEKGYTFAVL